MFHRSARLGLASAVCSVLILGSGCRRSQNSSGPKAGDVIVAEYKETVVVPPVVQTPPVTPPVVTEPTKVSPPIQETKPIVVAPPVTPKELPPVEAAPKGPIKPVRIRAGSISAWTDPHGNVWLADAGFTEGAMVDRGTIAIANTDMAALYTTERCCMEKFSWPVPNGKYTLKLHFAETFDEVKKAGDRLFSLNINGEKIKDFDIFKEAGGANRALIKTYHVDVKASKIEIDFTKSESKEPEINGLEILPE